LIFGLGPHLLFFVAAVVLILGLAQAQQLIMLFNVILVNANVDGKQSA
jgi:hypothetical protein